MHGSIVQINISRGGIPKRPIAEGRVNSLGIEGDGHAHPEIHGGPRKAVLLITEEGIEELKAQGYLVFPGALGENITTRGIDRRNLRIGQRYRIGEVHVEIVKVRMPCDTLTPLGVGIQKAIYDPDVKAGDHTSPRWGLSGFYAAVSQPGMIHPGDPIELLDELA